MQDTHELTYMDKKNLRGGSRNIWPAFDGYAAYNNYAKPRAATQNGTPVVLVTHGSIVGERAVPVSVSSHSWFVVIDYLAPHEYELFEPTSYAALQSGADAAINEIKKRIA